MADTALDQTKELEAHEQTWGGFVAMMKWGTVVSFLVAAGVVFLIAS